MTTQTFTENFEDICRFCLNKNELTNIYTFNYEGNSFSTVINKLLLIELDPNEDMPNNLCGMCVNNIILFHNFKSKCKESEIFLKTVSTERQHVKTGNLEVNDVKIEESADHEKNHKCSSCEERFFLYSDYINHRKEAKHGGVITFQCEYCDRELSQYTLIEHLRRHTNEKLFQCNTCTKKFISKVELKRHAKTHTNDNSYKCEICNETFPKKEILTKHREESSHFLEETEKKSFLCVTCGKQLSSIKSFKDHQRVHTGERPYSCQYCQKKFSQKTTLKRHIRIHTGEKPFSCHICGKAFGHTTHFKRHVSSHLGNKPHKCEECGKGFIQASALRIHFRTHTKEKPYVCHICGKGFTQKHPMKRCVNDHLRERMWHWEKLSAGGGFEEVLKLHLGERSKGDDVKEEIEEELSHS